MTSFPPGPELTEGRNKLKSALLDLDIEVLGGLGHLTGYPLGSRLHLGSELIGLAGGTILESSRGVEVAGRLVYYSWWFLTLEALLAVNVLASISSSSSAAVCSAWSMFFSAIRGSTSS